MMERRHVGRFDWNWNVVMGCSKESPGCEKCWAIEEVMQCVGPSPNLEECRAFNELVKYRADGTPDWTGDIRCNWDSLKDPLELPSMRICVGAYGDLFYPAVPAYFIRVVFDIMRAAFWHDFFIQTRHSERLLHLSPYIDWPQNVLMGVSIEDTQYFYRATDLLQTGAKRKFLSFEPLLDPIPPFDLSEIDWVIIGGEVGEKARQMDLNWVRNIRDWCAWAEVPLFVNRLGALWAWKNLAKDRTGGTMEEWPVDLQIRQFARTVKPAEFVAKEMV